MEGLDAVNRLGIFVLYNKQGIIERYVAALLKGFQQCCQRILVVVNGQLKTGEIEKIRPYINTVFYRENKGYDCGAIQDVLLRLYGWEKAMQYDELAIMNDTCYGPIYPLHSVCESMSKKDCDFWGLTDCGAITVDCDIWGITRLPYHIQSYFLVFRNKLLHSRCFRAFWENLTLSSGYYETVKNYELKMTGYFESAGFKGSSFVSYGKQAPYCYVFYEPYQLVRFHKMPLVKRKSHIFCPDDAIPFFSAFERKRFLEYLQSETGYDTNIIWDDLLQKYGMGFTEKLKTAQPHVKDLKEFCNKNDQVLIYGAGVFATMAANTFLLEELHFDGFLVTDGHKKEPQKDGKTVYELSELDNDMKKNLGVALGLESKFHSTVITSLHQHGINHIFAV